MTFPMLRWIGVAGFLGLLVLSRPFALAAEPRRSPTSSASVEMLSLYDEASGPMDLAVSGRLRGLGVGEKRYVRFADLMELPTVKLKLTGEFLPGEQEVTALFLSEVWARLPRENDADTLLAFCQDGYASIYPRTFIQKYRPFLVLQINGKSLNRWMSTGGRPNPGPYAISLSDAVSPLVGGLLDANHKKPWSVTEIAAVNQRQEFRIFYEGPWAVLTPRAEAGRELWLHSCFSCHTGPEGSVGGTKSGRPFEVLAAHAGYNRDYFKRFVRDPQGTMPGSKMERHAHYSDDQLEALMAFLIAEGGK